MAPALAVALQLQAAISAIDSRMQASFARERWSWVPVYGVYVTLHEERVREDLQARRVELETQRLLDLERP